MKPRKRAKKLVKLAKLLLVQARMYRQSATISTDTSRLWGFTDDNPARSARQLVKARKSRLEAYAVLKDVCMINGELYSEETVKGVKKLKKSLNGRNFRNWEEYNMGYAEHGLFRGVDPE